MREVARALAVLPAAALVGCLVIPTPGSEPYAEQQLERIGPGVTDREGMRVVHEDAHTTRSSERCWFYGHIRTVATVITGIYIARDSWPLGEAN